MYNKMNILHNAIHNSTAYIQYRDIKYYNLKQRGHLVHSDSLIFII